LSRALGTLWREGSRWVSIAVFGVIAAALLGSVVVIYSTIEPSAAPARVCR